MAVISMRQMIEAGAHFGHQTRRWNPKMKRFIFGERNGIYIIDLDQTLSRVETAYNYVRDMAADGGTILFVGTKKQAQDPVREAADRCNMPYVNERWLGGMLTNFGTISKRVGKMLELERQKQPAKLGSWPFEIGLWVGKSGTPNKMGNTKDQDESTARIRVMTVCRHSSELNCTLFHCEPKSGIADDTMSTRTGGPSKAYVPAVRASSPCV